ncbi:ATP-binding protein [Streptomyces sp. NPDC001633]|uniref:ATP-binding protein n=1 Tax=Streptomyces sp. NPDC001633 TaxID=3364595 RepID=UPI00367E2BB3
MAGRDVHLTAFAPPAPPAALRTLPRDVAAFTGREAELRRLLKAVDDKDAQGVIVHTVDGMPGVGKTSLATHAAHLLADRYPDGQLFVRLHAHTPGQHPADPTEVLATLLAGLGINPQTLPEGLEARSAIWRDRMVAKRMVLVLDDAADRAQIEPLLPASSTCRVLITSRQRLIALEGAVPLPLETLQPEEATQLFIRLAHRSPNGPEYEAVSEAVRLCGYLPLAISLLASRLAHHPAWTIATFTREFAAAQDLLCELAAGDRAVAAAFDLSYRALPPARQRLFRRLGLHPGPDIDAYATAALADMPLPQARRQLNALYTDHLLDELAPGRYRLHDLLRVYARARAEGDPADDNAHATDRLLDYYQHAAEAADQHLAPPTRSRTTTPGAVPVLAPGLGTREQALTWMRAERPNVFACVAHATRHTMHGRVIHLAAAASAFLAQEGFGRQATALHEAAVTAARYTGDGLEEAHALQNLFVARCAAGEYRAAAEAVERALALYRALGDRLGEANALQNLGIARRLTGDYSAAAERTQQALDHYRALGSREGEAIALQALSWIQQVVFQDHTAAADSAQQAVALHCALGNRRGAAHTLSALCVVRRMAGDLTEAAEAAEQALVLHRELGDQHGQARALNSLSRVRSVTGEYPAAARLAEESLGLYRALGDRHGEAEALQALACVKRAYGEHQAAADLAQQALDHYRALDFRHGEANALAALGQAQHLAGEHQTAADLFQRAQELFEEFGDAQGVARVLNCMGAVLADTAPPYRALAIYQRALQLACRVRSPLDEARALEGVARCHELAGHWQAALTKLHEAVTTYRRIGAAETSTFPRSGPAPPGRPGPRRTAGTRWTA